MQLKRSEILSNLMRKGFEKDQDGDHIFLAYRNRLGEKTPISTKLSHGSRYKDIGSNLIGKMARQCQLTAAQFVRLVKCDMSGEEYARLVGE